MVAFDKYVSRVPVLKLVVVVVALALADALVQ
jgi:hypothetical protein